MSRHKTRLWHRLLVLGVAGALSACGGGGDLSGDSRDARDWQAEQFLESSNEPAGNADVAINASGTGYAVWEQIDNGKSRIFSRRNRFGPWEVLEPVSAASEVATEPQVVVLPDGEALAMWLEAQGAGFKLVAARTANGTWGPVLAQLDQGDIGDLKLVEDGQGRALALWRRGDAILASHFVAGAFKAADQLSTATTSNAREGDIAMGADGNAVAVWREDNTAGGVLAERVFVRPFVNGNWRGVTPLADSFPDGARAPTVAVASGGRAVVAWRQKQGSSLTILARVAQDSRTGQWGGFAFLDGGNADFPNATMDPLGRATVVWLQGAVRNDIRAAHFNRTLWSPSVDIENDNAGNAFAPLVVSDALGRVVAVWRQRNGPFGDPAARTNLLANRFDPEGGAWDRPEPVETNSSGDVGANSLAVNSSGRALAAWDFRVPVNPAEILSVVGNVFQ